MLISPNPPAEFIVKEFRFGDFRYSGAIVFEAGCLFYQFNRHGRAYEFSQHERQSAFQDFVKEYVTAKYTFSTADWHLIKTTITDPARLSNPQSLVFPRAMHVNNRR